MVFMELWNIVVLCGLLVFSGHTTGVTVVSSTLGRSVYMELPPHLSKYNTFIWSFKNVPLARRFSGGAPEYKAEYRWRCELFANGTLRLDNIEYEDDGDYELYVKMNGDGVNNTAIYTLNVYYNIEAVQEVWGRLGKSVEFVLPFLMPKYNHFQWYSEKKPLTVRSSQKDLYCLDEHRQRCHVSANGTLKLDNISFADDVDYSVIIYDVCGKPAVYVPYDLIIYPINVVAPTQDTRPPTNIPKGISTVVGFVGVVIIIIVAVVATIIKIKKETHVYETPDFSLGPIYVNTIVGQQMVRSTSTQSQEKQYENLTHPDKAIYNDLINPPVAQ